MANKAIFLDRDDTLIEDPGYINKPEQVKLLDGAAEALIEFSAMGYKTVVVSNQSAVARGMVTEKVLGDIHKRLQQLLAEEGAYLDKIYYCPFHPEGVVAKYRKESDCRKPNPGMLLTAAKEMDIDLEQSWMIGNGVIDIEAGLRAGCKTILIKRPLHYELPQPGEPTPDYKAINLKEAVNIIKQYHRSAKKPELEAPVSDLNQDNWDEDIVQEIEEPQKQSAEEKSNAETAVSAPVEELTESSEFEEYENEDVRESAVYESGDRTEQLLNSILRQLRSMHRTDMFGEFSIMKLTAGIVQFIVLGCLLITIWFLMGPKRQDNAIFISLGFAMVLQVMSLTLYMMHGRK